MGRQRSEAEPRGSLEPGARAGAGPQVRSHRAAFLQGLEIGVHALQGRVARTRLKRSHGGLRVWTGPHGDGELPLGHQLLQGFLREARGSRGAGPCCLELLSQQVLLAKADSAGIGAVDGVPGLQLRGEPQVGPAGDLLGRLGGELLRLLRPLHVLRRPPVQERPLLGEPGGGVRLRQRRRTAPAVHVTLPAARGGHPLRVVQEVPCARPSCQALCGVGELRLGHVARLGHEARPLLQGPQLLRQLPGGRPLEKILG